VQEGDSFPLCSDPRLLVDELNAGCPAPRQHAVEIVDREADVMYPGPSFGHEARDGGVGVIRFQKLYQRLTRAESDYARTVGIVERNLRQPQHIPKKRKALGEGLDRDADVGYASSTRG
jgi:hypothetical protein